MGAAGVAAGQVRMRPRSRRPMPAREGGADRGDARRTDKRDFPAGSYIIRMDQPYSRIADALLDYQYWCA